MKSLKPKEWEEVNIDSTFEKVDSVLCSKYEDEGVDKLSFFFLGLVLYFIFIAFAIFGYGKGFSEVLYGKGYPTTYIVNSLLLELVVVAFLALVVWFVSDEMPSDENYPVKNDFSELYKDNSGSGMIRGISKVVDPTDVMWGIGGDN